MDRIDGLGIEDPLSYGFDDVNIYFSSRVVRRVTVNESIAYAPDLLSYSSYGTYDFWRFLCCLNRIRDPFQDLKPGLVVYVPRHSDVLEYLSSRSSKRPEVDIVELGSGSSVLGLD